MAGFFYKTESDIKRLEKLDREIGNINSRIASKRRELNIKESNLSIPPEFNTAWLLYTASGGSAIEQKHIEENFTTLQLYEWFLMKSMETLSGM